LGIGPGAGTEDETGKMLQFIIRACKKPMVLDADALNLLAQQPNLLAQLFQNTILTPHPKEFERLFGACQNDFERIETACRKAAELKVVIILKGHHTLIALPDGTACFNSTGNAGMAKGGSGDVLTGIITALLAQGYSAADAAILGVYLHGVAGDAAAAELSHEAMTAGDLVTHLSKAFLHVNQL
jgi:NAD(P)H-hydrate epimerase